MMSKTKHAPLSDGRGSFSLDSTLVRMAAGDYVATPELYLTHSLGTVLDLWRLFVREVVCLCAGGCLLAHNLERTLGS